MIPSMLSCWSIVRLRPNGTYYSCLRPLSSRFSPLPGKAWVHRDPQTRSLPHPPPRTRFAPPPATIHPPASAPDLPAHLHPSPQPMPLYLTLLLPTRPPPSRRDNHPPLSVSPLFSHASNPQHAPSHHLTSPCGKSPSSTKKVLALVFPPC